MQIDITVTLPGMECTFSLTCCTKSNKCLSVFSQDVLGGWKDPQLGQEMLNEIMRHD